VVDDDATVEEKCEINSEREIRGRWWKNNKENKHNAGTSHRGEQIV